MLQESTLTQKGKKLHTVESTYRCLATHLKSIVSLNEIDFNSYESQLIKQILLKLNKKERKKSSIVIIFFGSKEDIISYLKTLKICLDNEVNETDMKRAQQEIRLKICENYEINSSILWNIYQKQLQTFLNQKQCKKQLKCQVSQIRRDENIEILKRLMNEIFIEKKLLLNGPEKKTNGRISIKKIIKKDVSPPLEEERESLFETKFESQSAKQYSLISDQFRGDLSSFGKNDLLFSLGENTQLDKPIQLGSFFQTQILGKTQIGFPPNECRQMNLQ